MQETILVITPQASFGELIRQSLEETGHYRVEVAYHAADALARCRRPATYRLVILDGDLPGEPLDGLIQQIRQAQPEARIAAIPSDAERMGAQTPPVDGTLSKPFYLPSLAATVERLISGVEPTADPHSAERKASAAWPENPAECQAALTNLMVDVEALGALLLVGGEIRAAAGLASGDGYADLVNALRSRLSGGSGSELLFYRKSSDGASRILVYAVGRGEADTLALVFPPEMNYSQARTRVKESAPA